MDYTPPTDHHKSILKLIRINDTSKQLKWIYGAFRNVNTGKTRQRKQYGIAQDNLESILSSSERLFNGI